MGAERILRFPPEDICTDAQRERIVELSRHGRELVGLVAAWSREARVAVADLNRGLDPFQLSDGEHALVSLLTGASELMAVGSDLVDAAEHLCAADPPSPGG